MIRATILIAALLWSPVLQAQGLAEADRLKIDSMIIEVMERGGFPGASLLVGNRSGILYEKTYGHTDSRKLRPVEPDDLYDMASCTKIMATTLSVMRLVDQGRLDIGKSVGDYTDRYRDTPLDRIRITSLLTHTSGMGNINLYEYLYTNPRGGALTSSRRSEHFPTLVDRNTYLCADPAPDTAMISRLPRDNWRRIDEDMWINPAIDSLIHTLLPEKFNAAMRGRYIYSDLNFMLLRHIIEAITGSTMAAHAYEAFRMLDMRQTGFSPREWYDAGKIIPTETDRMIGRGLVVGYPHDNLGAVAPGQAEGNAGIFSTARDISCYCRMILDNGRCEGEQIVSRRTLDLFTSARFSTARISRGYGFDRSSRSSPLYGGFGHTGYTGTIIWIDPRLGLYMIFLSNRVNPLRTPNILAESELRSNIWEYLKKL